MKHRAAVLSVLFVAAFTAIGDSGNTGLIYSKTNNGGIVSWTASPLPANAFGHVDTPPKLQPPFSTPTAPVVSSAVAEAIETGSPDDTVELVVSFRDDVEIPFFPKLDPRYSRNHPENLRTQAQRDRLVEQLAAVRERTYRQRQQQLEALDIRTRETFWLSDAMVVVAPLRSIMALAHLADVQRIQLARIRQPAPFVTQGRALINSDPLFNFVTANANTTFAPHVAILDTGSPMPLNHSHFTPRTRIELEKDCFHALPNSNCNTTTLGWDPYDRCNHATSSSGILTSTDSGSYRGVTPFQVGTYKIYDTACQGGIPEAMRGLAAAVADGYSVLLVETQQVEPTANDSEPLASQANQAFNAGCAVIATAGNFGNTAGISTMVRSPANARNVIAVGAQSVQSSTPDAYNSHGPTPDQRVKPDVLGPTNTITASSDGSVQQFGGTSGAAPYVAAGAALLGAYWNRTMSGGSFSWVIAPGQIYAGLIDAGNRVNFDNTWGAGRIRLLDPNWLSGHGEVTLSTNGSYADIPTGVIPVGMVMKAAVWWQDSSTTATHNDIDLALGSTGGWYQSINSANGVFEKVQSATVNSPMPFNVRIIAYNLPVGPQRIFYSWHAAAP